MCVGFLAQYYTSASAAAVDWPAKRWILTVEQLGRRSSSLLALRQARHALLGAALDTALLAMKTVEEGSISSDELLQMHRCTEAIRYLRMSPVPPSYRRLVLSRQAPPILPQQL
jgi:hypothetical protein